MRNLHQIQNIWLASSYDDAEVMLDAYDHMNDKDHLPGIDAERILNETAGRIHVEFFLNDPQREHALYPDGSKDGFKEWVDQETHLEMERQGFIWDNEHGRFSPGGLLGIQLVYSNTRQRILHAVVRRAVDFFRQCEDFKPPQDDPNNLRTDLRPYLYQKKVA